MLACFEQHFGKYPFPRDGFTLLESPYPMEHQSGVCIGKIKEGMRPDYAPMIWHESAHEWWGNAISCKDIADMWMHEAFATYAEALMMECIDGKAIGVTYLNEQKDQVNNHEPVTGLYNVNHIHYNIGDMYTKGSLMLNTFRFVLDNDTLWFNLLKDVQQHFRYQTLSSEELVGYIGQRTGTNYTWFFDQYLKYTNLPKLEISLKEQHGNLQLTYRWHADVSGFKMPVKVTVAPGRFGFIYPRTDWQMITLKQMKENDFEVDEDHFYIQVESVSKLTRIELIPTVPLLSARLPARSYSVSAAPILLYYLFRGTSVRSAG
jgi:aminopeptidase N